jgi:methylaspartate ammonia-lyase
MKTRENRLVHALRDKYIAEMSDAIARFEIYITNPVAIGEHPQFTEEMNTLVEQYVNAKDKMEVLLEMVNKINE